MELVCTAHSGSKVRILTRESLRGFPRFLMCSGILLLNLWFRNTCGVSEPFLSAALFKFHFLLELSDIVCYTAVASKIYPMGVYEGSDSEMEENQKHCCCCDNAPEADAAADAAVPCCCRHKERSPEEYKALLNRLNRIEGQVRGIRGMLEKEAYCVDILVQVAAANAALNSFSRELLAQHIGSCVADDLRAGSDEKLEELLRLLPKLMK